MSEDKAQIQHITVVVIGPFCSGKSTFIESLAETPVELGGTITIEDGYFLYLHSPGGSMPYAWLHEDTFVDTVTIIGVILILNSSQAETFREVTSRLNILQFYYDYDEPLVVAANFQDDPNARDISDIRITCRIGNDIPIVPCVATDKKSVANVLITLLEKVLDDLDTNAEPVNSE